MRRDFSTFPYKYQGMEKEHKEYLRYLEWLDKLLKNEIQSMDQVFGELKIKKYR